MEPLTEIGYKEFNDGDDIIPPEQIEPYSILIFDDVLDDILKSQSRLEKTYKPIMKPLKQLIATIEQRTKKYKSWKK